MSVHGALKPACSVSPGVRCCLGLAVQPLTATGRLPVVFWPLGEKASRDQTDQQANRWAVVVLDDDAIPLKRLYPDTVLRSSVSVLLALHFLW